MRGQKQSKVGMIFGRLTVVEYLGGSRWRCMCECGNETVVLSGDLTGNKTRSCGCLHAEELRARLTTHGGRKERLYHIWINMKSRCYNSNDKEYKNYGGRGVTICNEWKDDFRTFREWSKANGYREDLTIDRIDVNGNYTPDNCRWVTMVVQANNSRRNVFLTHNGKTQTVAQWAREMGVNHRMLHKRLKRGWSVEKTLKELEEQHVQKICND